LIHHDAIPPAPMSQSLTSLEFTTSVEHGKQSVSLLPLQIPRQPIDDDKPPSNTVSHDWIS
jgi:hypothetical protein